MARSNTIKAAGLYTYLSELQSPEGSQVIADNINIDELGVISSRRGFNDYGAELALDSYKIKQIMEYKNRILRYFNDTIEYDDGNGNFSAFSGSFSEVEEGFRIKSAEVNGNFYFTSVDGIKKISASSPSELNSNTGFIVDAGVTKAIEVSAKTLPLISGFLPPQSKVAYKILFGYKDANNVLVLGSPTSRYVVTNRSSDVIIPEQSTIQFLKTENTTPTPSTFASFDEAVVGVGFGNVQLTADVAGTAGNLIELIGDGTPIGTLVTNWNALNPSNTVTLDSIFAHGPEPLPIGSDIQLSGGTDASTGPIYIGNYFTIETLDQGFYVWFSELGGTTDKPQDSGTLGRTGIEVPIGPSDTPEQIAEKTANVLYNELFDFFSVSLLGLGKIRFISKEEGDIEPILLGNLDPSDMLIETTQQGDVSEGTSANCEVSTIIPQGVTTNYFMQVYRTRNITATDGLTVDDIDPGEDCNLVYEEPVTESEGTTVTIIDITPNSFRDTGVPLYNNPISGQGILQSNDVPPISKDIQSFNNFTFYSNTKTFHKYQFTMVSVDDFGDEETSITISNEDVAREYVFQGDQEEIDIICDTIANTSETNGNDSYITIYSANEERKYIIWFDKGGGIAPLVDYSTSIRVDLSANGIDVNDNVGEYLELALLDFSDFQVSYDLVDTVNIINVNNGAVTPTNTPTSDPRIDLSPLPIINATFDDPVLGILTGNVELSADIGGVNGNNIVLNGDGFASLSTLVSQWNIANPTNTVTLNSADGFPNVGTVMQLTGGSGSSWDITNTTQGRGEDSPESYTNRALWSINPSTGQSIEETARSFIRVVNQDVDSPVKATYLSGELDLPGKILLENKQLDDKPFYIAVKNIGTIAEEIGAEFTPNLPIVNQDVTGIAPTIDISISKITSTNHGLNTGDNIYMYAPDNTPSIHNKYVVTYLDLNNFEIDFTTDAGDSTDAFFFKTDQVSDNEVKPNRIYFSKLSQPEAVPIVNFLDVGGRDEPIERILSLRDTLFVLKTDGIYTITGTSSPFNLRLLDNTSNILAPDSAVVLDNQIFALMDSGISVITESGASVISRSLENKILAVTGKDIDFRLKTFAVSYENDKAYIIWLPSASEDEIATQAYRYNNYERTWTRWTVPATSANVSKKNNILYIGDGTRPFLQKERKDRARTDFADRNFTRQIPNDSLFGKRIRLSTYVDVEEGDVIVQEQSITIDIYNNLLSKLDFDAGVNSSDYESTLSVSAGENITTKMVSLNNKLIGDGMGVSSYTWTNDIEELRTTYNDLIEQLNTLASGTQYKTYRIIERLTTYESIIEDKNTERPDFNEITLLVESRFFEGDIEIFKAIAKTIQWSPLHFGDPSAQKQFSKGTVILDQNNFTKAVVSYSSELSQGFVEIEKEGSGVGYFSASYYSNPTLYWGGNGNDAPLMSIIPREKQRGRYINIKFNHAIAREGFRILGVSTVVRLVSDRAYR